MEKIRNFIELIMLLLLICASSGLGIQSYKLASARQQLEYYRTELESATDRQQDALNTIDECYRNVTRTGEILSESVNTVQGIRKQVSEIRENYETIENRLLQFYDDVHRPDYSTNSTVGN